MDPQIIILALTAAGTLIRQAELYSRGQMSEEEIKSFHENVMTFMHNIQNDANTLRSGK
jgi:hypothetical protein